MFENNIFANFKVQSWQTGRYRFSSSETNFKDMVDEASKILGKRVDGITSLTIYNNPFISFSTTHNKMDMDFNVRKLILDHKDEMDALAEKYHTHTVYKINDYTPNAKEILEEEGIFVGSNRTLFVVGGNFPPREKVHVAIVDRNLDSKKFLMLKLKFRLQEYDSNVDYVPIF